MLVEVGLEQELEAGQERVEVGRGLVEVTHHRVSILGLVEATHHRASIQEVEVFPPRASIQEVEVFPLKEEVEEVPLQECHLQAQVQELCQ